LDCSELMENGQDPDPRDIAGLVLIKTADAIKAGGLDQHPIFSGDNSRPEELAARIVRAGGRAIFDAARLPHTIPQFNAASVIWPVLAQPGRTRPIGAFADPQITVFTEDVPSGAALADRAIAPKGERLSLALARKLQAFANCFVYEMEKHGRPFLAFHVAATSSLKDAAKVLLPHRLYRAMTRWYRRNYAR
jgi:hypothetical protein